jgi:hypothetical protein
VQSKQAARVRTQYVQPHVSCNMDRVEMKFRDKPIRCCSRSSSGPGRPPQSDDPSTGSCAVPCIQAQGPRHAARYSLARAPHHAVQCIRAQGRRRVGRHIRELGQHRPFWDWRNGWVDGVVKDCLEEFEVCVCVCNDCGSMRDSILERDGSFILHIIWEQR